jgi:Chaperone of endosialidase
MKRITTIVILCLGLTGAYSQNVGIGTTDPQVKLSTIGVTRASFDVLESEYVEIKHGGANGIINTVGDGLLLFQHDGISLMSMNDTGNVAIVGNVGIGTSFPTSDLEISGVDNTDAIKFDNGRTRLRHHFDLLATERSSMRFLIDADNNQGDAEFSIYTDVDSSSGTTAVVRLDLDGNESWINGGGNLGIGTTTPASKLSVIGLTRTSFDTSETEYVEIKHGGFNGVINTAGDGLLLFQHDGITQMAVSDSGQVGIGTGFPTSDLEIVGTEGTDAIKFDGGQVRLRHHFDLLSSDRDLMNILLDADNDQANSSFSIFNHVSTSMGNLPAVTFHLDGASSWINGGGNLGIGTITPGTKLSIVGTTRTSFDPTEAEFIEVTHDGSHALINTAGDGVMKFQHDNDTKMVVNDLGRVGIGTTTPGRRLSVIGTARAAVDTTETEFIEIKHGGFNGIVNTVGDGLLLFQHDGITQMAVSDSGQVGIGTGFPTSDLEIVGTEGTDAIKFDGGQVRLRHHFDLLSSDRDLMNILLDADNDQANSSFSIFNHVSTSMDNLPAVTFHLDGASSWINGGGNLGIGTITPATELSIVGTTRTSFDATGAEFIEVTHDGSDALINTVGDGVMKFQHDNDTKMVIDDMGKVGIGTITPGTNLSVTGLVRASFNTTESEYVELTHGGANGIINTVGDGNLDFRHDGNTLMSLTDAGNLGIGTINPSSDLEIFGADNTIAIKFDNGNTRLRHHFDVLSTDRSSMRFLVDADNNQNNAEFSIFTNDSSSSGNTAVVRFDLDGNDSWINGGGNLGIGTTTPTSDLEIAGDFNTDAIELDQGRFRLRHHFDFISTDWDLFNILLDADNNQSNSSFSLYNHVSASSGNTPAVTFHLDGSNSWINGGGNLGIGRTNPTHPLHMGSGAHVTAGGVWTNASDISKKKEIENLEYGLEEVMRMMPKRYLYKTDDSESIGFIAQEMEEIIPEVVSGEEGEKGIAYGLLTATLVNAIKEQQKTINELLLRIEKLEGEH